MRDHLFSQPPVSTRNTTTSIPIQQYYYIWQHTSYICIHTYNRLPAHRDTPPRTHHPFITGPQEDDEFVILASGRSIAVPVLFSCSLHAFLSRILRL
jgi:hypothetical protein